MTEKEAIENIKNYIRKCNYTWTVESIFGEYIKHINGSYVSYTAMDVIGNCHRSLEKLSIKALEEIQQYREIGTVEECREAVERQKAKRPKKVLRHRGGFNKYHCPNCDTDYCKDERYEIKEEYCPVCGKLMDSCFRKFCGNCGQAID